MSKVFEWIKQNKVTTVLIILVLWLVFFRNRNHTITFNGFGSKTFEAPDMAYEASPMSDSFSSSGMSRSTNYYYPKPQAPLQTEVTDRKIVTTTNISLLVKDVSETTGKILTEASALGGFMVSRANNSPIEGATGQITVRVPSDKVETFMDKLRGLAIRVVSENVDGYDITDQYVDTEARLATLTKTKTMFEGILEKTTDVDEILRVQERILNVQSQIESLQGQLQHMKGTSEFSLVTVYLATDDLALPYAPGNPWRPNVVFKYAVRSLVKDLRGVGNTGIWLGVYAVFWLPVLILAIVIIKVLKKRRQTKTLQ